MASRGSAQLQPSPSSLMSAVECDAGNNGEGESFPEHTTAAFSEEEWKWLPAERQDEARWGDMQTWTASQLQPAGTPPPPGGLAPCPNYCHKHIQDHAVP